MRREKTKRLLELLRRAATTPVEPDSVERDNRELIELLAPVLDIWMRFYFRQEIEGIEEVPEGKALFVFNHESGISAAQVLGMGARWYLRRGTGEQLVGLMHDDMFNVPAMGNILGHLGGVRASHATAEAAFEQGCKVVVAPGGNLEAFRPYSERNVIKFGGRKGWARLALRAGVPVVPIVFAGGQETFYVLHDGHQLVSSLGLKRFLRVDTWPIFLGLPWGIGVGPLFHLPLPSKSSVRFLEAIEADETGPDAALDEAQVDALYGRVTRAMQAALSELGAARHLPILG